MYYPEDRHSFETLLLYEREKYRRLQKENARLIKENQELKVQLRKLQNVRHSDTSGVENSK